MRLAAQQRVQLAPSSASSVARLLPQDRLQAASGRSLRVRRLQLVCCPGLCCLALLPRLLAVLLEVPPAGSCLHTHKAHYCQASACVTIDFTRAIG